MQYVSYGQAPMGELHGCSYSKLWHILVDRKEFYAATNDSDAAQLKGSTSR